MDSNSNYCRTVKIILCSFDPPFYVSSSVNPLILWENFFRPNFRILQFPLYLWASIRIRLAKFSFGLVKSVCHVEMTSTRASAWFQKPINTSSMVRSDRNISFAKVRWKHTVWKSCKKQKLEQRFKVSGKLQVRKYIYSLRINTHIRNKILFKCYWNSSNFWKSLMKFLVDIRMLWFL